MATRKGRQYHHGELHAALLDAAERVLSRDGRGELSLREIARLAGVTHTAAYHHFDGRDAVVRALAARGFDRLTLALASAGRGATGPDAFLEVGVAYVGFAARNPGLFRLMFGPLAAAGRGTDPGLRESADRAFAVLKEGARSVTPSGGEAGVMGTALRSWSAVHGLAALLLDDQLEHLGLALRDHERIARAVLSGGPLQAMGEKGGRRRPRPRGDPAR